jgi:hypothetical protein
MNKFFRVLLKCLPLFVLMPQLSWAALTYVGPLDPANGFPRWYKDANGRRLTLCLETDSFCNAFDDVDPALPISFPGNFPHEAFWWSADAAVDVGDGEIRLILALEAAFAGEVAVPGERISFSRLRIRARGIPLGTYRITHPYGVNVFQVTNTDGRQINMTNDIGIEIEKFTGALTGDVGPFLVWDPAIAPLAPAGFVGDPAVEHQVIGSPFGTNFLRVERLINSRYTVVASTNLFLVQGKLDTRPEEPILEITPKGGIYQTAPIVTIRSSIPASIYYTLDGSNPLSSLTRFQYAGPFRLPDCAAIKFAAQTSNAQSDVGTEIFVKTP